MWWSEENCTFGRRVGRRLFCYGHVNRPTHLLLAVTFHQRSTFIVIVIIIIVTIIIIYYFTAVQLIPIYRGADKSLAQPTSRLILFDGENISFDAILVTHINNSNIPPIMIIYRIYENQNHLSL
jgi:hypothetical protein